jgi:DNA-binding winged helix-turn-helix (wHTH) protein
LQSARIANLYCCTSSPIDPELLMTRSSYADDTPALEFGPFRLITASQLLFCGNRRVNLGSRARAILLELVENAGQLVAHAQLLQRAWPVANVAPGTLRVHVAALRKTLSEFTGESDCIQNIHGHGYRLVMPVRRVSSGQSQRRAVDLLPALLQRLEDSKRLLYATRAHVLEILESLEPHERAQLETIEEFRHTT